jgi:hypothetical protein
MKEGGESLSKEPISQICQFAVKYALLDMLHI